MDKLEGASPMPRPYLNWSIVQLEAEFERAQDDGDQQALKTLEQELGVRTSSRARKLRESLAMFLGNVKQTSDRRRKQSPIKRSESAQVRRVSSSPSEESVRMSPPKAASLRRTPTDEQQQAIDLFGKGGSLKINAYAGTGKTSTLEMLAHSTSKRGQYIAFNKSIVRDAEQKFPTTVNCSTIHGLAFKATPSGYKDSSDKMQKRLNANQLAEILNLKRWQIDKFHTLAPRSQGYLILETLRRFMQGANTDPVAADVPRHGSLLTAPEPILNAVTEFALHAAKHVWGRMRQQGDPIPLGHDGYVKLWAQSAPMIAADYILLDEAQDTNPVILDVLLKQESQMIYVGDRYQQIYEWRGAVNAMEKIETDSSTFLTTSFRFGPQIATAASAVLRLLNESKAITGNPKVVSRIGDVEPETILARTNASTMTAVIESVDAGNRPHLIGGKEEIMDMLRGVQDLKEGRQSTVPDFFGFEKWDQVVEFAKSGEGDHLMTFVNLVEGRGERQLMWALNRTVDLEKSNIIVSTAHKAKGQEWPNVRLMDDFIASRPKAKKSHEGGAGAHDPAEMRLFYVALTRAKEAIEVPSSMLSLIGLGARR